MKALLLTLSFLLVLTLPAQNLELPRVSQQASVSQTIGVARVQLNYSRPAVRDRTVWGELVPYGEKPMPWRAGADENTVITLSHDARVQGQPLAAGTYGLHMVPGKDKFIVIFNREHNAWGSYFYNPDLDVLRVEVTPEAGEFTENLVYVFDEVTDRSARLELRWETLSIPLSLSFDTPALVMEDIRRQLHGLSAFFHQPYQQAAAWCLQENTELKQAEIWANQAANMSPTFTNLMTLSRTQRAQGKSAEADETRARALKTGTNQELNAYGYALLGAGKTAEAVEIFEINAKRNPKDPNVFDSLGEGYLRAGKMKEARKSLEKCLSMDPPANVRANSEKLLAELKNK